MNKDKNVYRFAVRGHFWRKKEQRERDRKKENR